MTKNRPVHEVRLGSVKATIWANDTQAGIRHNITLAKLYRDGDAWKTTPTLGRDDLLVAAKVLEMAHTWVFDAAA